MKIKLENISKSFKNNVVFENVNLNFDPGKIYGIIGKNGSGKSVLLKLICGFYSADSGKIYFDDQCINLSKLFAPNTRALIERPNFLPNLSGFENLKLLASIQNKIGEEEILDTLKKVNLYDEKDKKYSKYSLGMKQKLGIAQVLMENPDVEILDEPFNGIDDESIDMIRDYLTAEKKKNKIIILATHLKDDIEALCDEVYKIDNCSLTRVK